MRTLTIFLFCLTTSAQAQELYFPPIQGGTWETIDPASLGWCADQIPPLLQFLDESNTKAFILLKDGRIVIENYFGTFTQDSVWYWASAGKSLTAFLVGLAQQEGSLNINDPTSVHLGPGWTSLSPGQEQAITIRHQLTMTTGLDDGGELDCTDPSCLTWLAPPGTRWSYHNAPYTLLDGVLSSATGMGLNQFLFSRLSLPVGITGTYLQVGNNNVFFSRARSMARFGLLMQAGGTWNGDPILNDQEYIEAMITPSQGLNEAYGYLWWLNGTSTYMLPQTQFVFTGPALPNAPLDTYMALGKNGQIINVVPSQGLVVVRMGNMPDMGIFVPNAFNDQIWEHLNAVLCLETSMGAIQQSALEFTLAPDPANDRLSLESGSSGTLRIIDARGISVLQARIAPGPRGIDVAGLPSGVYFASFTNHEGTISRKFVKQ
jgi:CubicO group peptidase (beta-lactamase class C family)